MTSSGRLTSRKAFGFGILLRFDFEWIDLEAGTEPDVVLVDVVVVEGLIYRNLSPNLIHLVVATP